MRKLILALLLTVPLFARDLSWDAVAVHARLDGEGRLHVREEQSYLFDGDWNGGERLFRVEPGQSFQFESIQRRDANGLTPLTEGSLDEVMHYQFTDSKSLRWRTRLSTDPPYANQRMTFVLEYTLSGILLRNGDRYRLDHDFAFPQRPGEIRKFTLDLELAPEWSSPNLLRHYEASPLGKGRGFVVKADLDYSGANAPSGDEDPVTLRNRLAAAVIGVPILLALFTFGRDAARGRFARLTTSSVTPAWIEQHLLPLDAEIIGAAWDESVGSGEVSALLARWTAEKKITATHQGKEMTLHLEVARDSFSGYEKELIEKLFFSGNTTSTAGLRQHYKKSGFQPALMISPELLEKARQATGDGPKRRSLRWLPTLFLFAAAVTLYVNGFRAIKAAGTEPPVLTILGIVLTVILWMIGAGFATHWRQRIDYGVRGTLTFLIPLSLAMAMAWFVLQRSRIPVEIYYAAACAALMVANSIFNAARSRHGRAGIAFRKRLASVREYFASELKTPHPTIDDRWFPYVIAFGLDDEASRWMRDFGAESVRSGSYTTTSTSSSSSSSGSLSTPQWSGGGGAFGGAGATGSWTAAATGIAAGVASASSSSSSGGGGGGGGSSSGGGGGGGW